MPGGDRTGPLGRGPMTGRALGFCSGNASPGFSNFGFGRGRGRGRGFGFARSYYGPRRMWTEPVYPTSNTEDEKVYLEQMIRDLEAEIKAVREKLKNLSEEK